MKEEKAKKEAAANPVKKTRGKVDFLDGREWRYMKKEHALSDTEIMKLKGVMCPAKVNNTWATLVRIFNPDIAKEKGVTVEDFESLNEHPELILYDGYKVNNSGGELIIEKREGVGTSLLEKKIKEGAITEVGVEREKTTTEKWLGRFWNFLMMGGFILVIIFIVVIFVVISIISKGC
jgi:hypothetical protein